jgi:hypothetical protein
MYTVLWKRHRKYRCLRGQVHRSFVVLVCPTSRREDRGERVFEGED